MVDILHKNSSLRTAIAEATVLVSSEATIDAIEHKKVPKGDVFEFSRAAGLLAIKKTPDLIPDCHPLPIEKAAITFRIQDRQIIITVEVATVYKTGVEVEAMHGASLTALTIYDMLKPIDPHIEIQHIRLLEKKGGKKDYQDELKRELKIAVIVCSDSVHQGGKSDKSGLTIQDELKKNNLTQQHYEIIPDEKSEIHRVLHQLQDQQFDLVLFTGGTGLSPRDITPDAVNELIDRPVPGIMEAARQYGQQRTPYAMLSRGVAGYAGKLLILTLPGSSRGVKESMQALFPALKHVFKVATGMRHD
jgi:molybdenum cofactor biosynthesis protein MoaC